MPVVLMTSLGDSPRPIKPRKRWVYEIVRWDGNTLAEKHRMTVRRQSEYNARTVVRAKYPLSAGYREELADYYAI